MNYPQLEDCIRFHGHACGGIAIGYVMATCAMDYLNVQPDEFLYCRLDFQNCMTDSIQFVTGCTAGKRNLEINPIGKNSFVLVRAESGEGVRVKSVYQFPEGVSKEESVALIMAADPAQVCRLEPVKITVPERKRPTYVKCDICGEDFDGAYAAKINDKCCCPECADKAE